MEKLKPSMRETVFLIQPLRLSSAFIAFALKRHRFKSEVGTLALRVMCIELMGTEKVGFVTEFWLDCCKVFQS